MRQLSKLQLLGTFITQHSLRKDSIGRLLGAFAFSTVSGLSIVYYNYQTYWRVTIERVQTVDFNILANTLPNKLSTQLLKNDQKGLQATLDSNYGLFGIVVTDCKSDRLDCPQQKIIYATKSIVKTTGDGKQKLEPQNSGYPPSWTEKFNSTEYPAKQLKGDFLILRDPPPLKQEWKFDSPRSTEKVTTGEENNGNIIGRVYLLRGNPPSFQSEVQSWLRHPGNNSSKNFVYNAITGSAIITGVLVWLLTELASYIKFNADRKELEAEKKIRQAAQKELEAEQKICQLTEQALLANQNAIKARSDARKYREIAESFKKSEPKTQNQQDKLEAEQRATEAEEKLAKAEQRATEAEEKLAKERQQLERDKEKLAQDRQDIMDMIEDDDNDTIEALSNENNALQEKIENLRQEINNLRNENSDLQQRINTPPASRRDRNKVVNVEGCAHHRPKSWEKLKSKLENLEWIELVRYNESAFAAPTNGLQLSRAC